MQDGASGLRAGAPPPTVNKVKVIAHCMQDGASGLRAGVPPPTVNKAGFEVIEQSMQDGTSGLRAGVPSLTTGIQRPRQWVSGLRAGTRSKLDIEDDEGYPGMELDLEDGKSGESRRR
eukprot:4332357-Amphidinium_carterae.1